MDSDYQGLVSSQAMRESTLDSRVPSNLNYDIKVNNPYQVISQEKLDLNIQKKGLSQIPPLPNPGAIPRGNDLQIRNLTKKVAKLHSQMKNTGTIQTTARQSTLEKEA